MKVLVFNRRKALEINCRKLLVFTCCLQDVKKRKSENDRRTIYVICKEEGYQDPDRWSKRC